MSRIPGCGLTLKSVYRILGRLQPCAGVLFVERELHLITVVEARHRVVCLHSPERMYRLRGWAMVVVSISLSRNYMPLV